MTTLLEARGVSKHFGGVFAVEDVDLGVEQGEIHCLIGPNGAGKSTLFKLIVGTYAPSAGSIAFRGTDMTKAAPFQRVKQGMSIKMQAPSVFKALPVRQNLHIALQHHMDRGKVEEEEDRLLGLLGLAEDAAKEAGALSHGQQQWLEIGMALALKPLLLLLDEPTAGLSPEETFRTGELIGGGRTRRRLDVAYEYFPILNERRKQMAGTMSGGQQQQLAIGRALVGQPGLILLDEPSEGIQPSIVQLICRVLREIRDNVGTTIVFVEQNLDTILALAERCYIMEKGQVVGDIAHGSVSRGSVRQHLLL